MHWAALVSLAYHLNQAARAAIWAPGAGSPAVHIAVAEPRGATHARAGAAQLHAVAERRGGEYPGLATADSVLTQPWTCYFTLFATTVAPGNSPLGFIAS